MRLRTRARALTLALVLGLAGRAASTPAPTPDYARALDHSLCFDRCELTDQVGGMDATLANGATCTAGEGVVLDGVDDYVDLVDQALGGAMTIAVWARWDALNYYARVFSFADGAPGDNVVVCTEGSTTAIRFTTDAFASNAITPVGAIALTVGRS